jgi:hypothetical protein
MLLFAGNVKIVRAIKSVETANYQELTEHALVKMHVYGSGILMKCCLLLIPQTSI